jgi:Asp-tRNA(Asn)/Glu-tRNA(Gln) amidotransferase A subunit family amidase
LTPTVAAAVRKAALMLEQAGAIVAESALPAFSFEEAWEVFAVLTHALIGAGLPDKTRDKLAASEHDFLTGDLSHRALQARGMRLSTPDFIGIQARRERFRWRGFSNILTWCFARPPLRDPSGTIKSPMRTRDRSRSTAHKGPIST